MGLSQETAILRAIYLAPEPLNVREITRRAKLSRSQITILNKLTDQGFILQKAVGNQKLNSFNFGNELAKAYAELFEAEKLEDFLQAQHGLRKVLENYRVSVYAACEGNLLAIILFGSYAQGTQTKASDIDLLTITADVEEKKFKVIQKKVKDAEMEARASYGFEISTLTARAKDIREWKAQNKEILNQIRRDKIILFGANYYLNEILQK